MIMQNRPLSHPSVSYIDNRNSNFFVIKWKEKDFIQLLSITKRVVAEYGNDLSQILKAHPPSELAYYIRHDNETIQSGLFLKGENLKDILNTIGISVVSKIPDEILNNEKDLYYLYFGVLSLLGAPCYENIDQMIIYPIITRQVSENKIIKSGNERVTNSVTPLAFHTDPATYNCLLCVNAGLNGEGENELVSTVVVHNKILNERPDLLLELYKPCYVDRRGEEYTGQRKFSVVPIFAVHNGLLMTSYTEMYHKTAIDKYNLKESALHKEALKYLDKTILDVAKENKIVYQQEDGNILLLNSHLTFHSRRAFRSEQRKLLRGWVYSLSYPTLPHLWGYPYE